MFGFKGQDSTMTWIDTLISAHLSASQHRRVTLQLYKHVYVHLYFKTLKELSHVYGGNIFPDWCYVSELIFPHVLWSKSGGARIQGEEAERRWRTFALCCSVGGGVQRSDLIARQPARDTVMFYSFITTAQSISTSWESVITSIKVCLYSSREDPITALDSSL